MTFTKRQLAVIGVITIIVVFTLGVFLVGCWGSIAKVLLSVVKVLFTSVANVLAEIFIGILLYAIGYIKGYDTGYNNP